MRIVVATFGDEGQLRPLVALAGGLVEAGHDVLLLAGSAAAPLASGAGVAFEHLGAEDAPSRAVRALAWHRRIDEFADGADVIIGASEPAWVAVSVADARHVTGMIAALHPMEPSRELPHPLSPRFDLPGPVVRHTGRLAAGAQWRSARDPLMDARARLGLPTFPRPWGDITHLLGYSPTLVPHPSDWDDLQVVTGDWPLIRRDEVLPTELEAFLESGEPPVCVSFGNHRHLDRPKVRETILAGLAGRRVILLGRGAREWADELPENAIGVEHCEHDLVFPLCSVVFHHGGPGTTHAAVRWGIPSVTWPVDGDNAFWAWRLAELGAAAPALSRLRLTPHAIAAAVTEASSSAVRQQVGRLAATLRQERGVENAVAAVERVAGR